MLKVNETFDESLLESVNMNEIMNTDNENDSEFLPEVVMRR